MSQWLPWQSLYLLEPALGIEAKESGWQVSGKACRAVSSDRAGLLNNILYKQEEAFNIRRTLKHQALCYASYNEY
jgi:hypothetical protein